MPSDDQLFVIFLNRQPDSVTPQNHITQHLEYLRALDDRGQLVLAGPFKGFPGGMVIVRADSLEKAHKIAQTDPFVSLEDRTYEVREWLLATRENDYRAK